MIYRYLTRSYVEALRLERFPVISQRSTAIGFRSEDEVLPRPVGRCIREGVKIGDYLYVREDHGLSFKRCGP